MMRKISFSILFVLTSTGMVCTDVMSQETKAIEPLGDAVTSQVNITEHKAHIDIYTRLAEQVKASVAHIENCQNRLATKNVSNETIKNCLLDEKNIEHINVYGRYVGIETPEVVGRFHLDKNFINNAPKTNGDINELIALLPGVQLSEGAFDVDAQQEIKAQEISISGGKSWQTGFFIDGMNYNSRQDPASSGNTSSENEIQGGVQSMNVNSDMVAAINVYDNNIPVEFGNFSGGVVDVETMSAFDEAKQTSFSMGYRGSQSDWANYHIINGTNQLTSVADEGDSDEDEITQYQKNSYSMKVHHRINENHGLFVSANYLDSVISGISLQEFKTETRKNANLLVKYSYREGWFDQLDWSFIYAPYESHDYIKDTLNSDYIDEGGAIGSTLNVQHDFGWANMKSEFNVSQSDNSRKAPPHYYIWLQADGKEWGQYSDGNDSVDIPVSKEGGYGDLDKVQTSLSWKNKLSINDFEALGVIHNIYLGSEVQYEKIQRDRDQDGYFYNSAIQHSTVSGDAPLNCSGYVNDCVEVSYLLPIEQFIEELGGTFDLNNFEHLKANDENTLITPQYFQSRLVYPEEHINADLLRYALFASDTIEVGRTTTTVSFRGEYDDFFKQLNVSPRLSVGIDVFDNGKSMAILGASRYYDAGLITYKIREQQIPSYNQYRPNETGYLQGWINSSTIADYQYRYTNVKMPYDDELMVGWKQATDNFGTFSLKYVKRFKEDQLAKSKEVSINEDGTEYIEMNNSGYGHSERLSFSWHAQYGKHSLWFNTSASDNYSSSEDYDTESDPVGTNNLVFYEGQIIAKDDLDQINTNFARPLQANLGWSIDWLENLTTTFTGTFTEGYKTAESTGGYEDIGDNETIDTCSECNQGSFLIPTYRTIEVDSRFLVNMGLNWQPNIYGSHSLNINVNISNLFDARTYAINAGRSGIEVGRQFWLGINYSFN